MRRRAVALAVTALCMAGSPVAAGSGNILYLLQDSSLRPDLGNTFASDQSLADDSAIGSALAPATQKGALNAADLSIAGSGGTIQLYQGNAAAVTDPIGNTATIGVEGVSAAIAVQQGDGNTTQIGVSGNLAFGSTTQIGDLNTAELIVTGPLAAGIIVQNGNNNDARLDVSGYSAVTYIQNGDNLSYQSLDGTPFGVSVWSNAGPILITQSSF